MGWRAVLVAALVLVAGCAATGSRVDADEMRHATDLALDALDGGPARFTAHCGGRSTTVEGRAFPEAVPGWRSAVARAWREAGWRVLVDDRQVVATTLSGWRVLVSDGAGDTVNVNARGEFALTVPPSWAGPGPGCSASR